jgi:tRNA modification GTPase
MSSSDTIVAIATPPGEGGIGIVRVSGIFSEKYLHLFYTPVRTLSEMESHRLYLGRFFNLKGFLIDEVMAVIMRAPHSYTREDVVEVHCHGGVVIVRQIIDQFLEAGARLAGSGEFTLRAFLNGRLDLSRAEAVIDLIRSRSDLASRMAAAQLHGSVYLKVKEFQSNVADILSLVEAEIDFPEEDIEFTDQNILLDKALSTTYLIKNILDNFDTGRILREGLSVLIFGKPNVGKSSLLNTLLGEARAIVTDIPGTTRDTIEENFVLGGVPLRLIDTAGVCESNDPIEAQGVARAKAKIAFTDLILLVIDSSHPVDEDDMLALEACGQGNILVVHSKSDVRLFGLNNNFHGLPVVEVSTRTGSGIESLKESIIRIVCGELSLGEASTDIIFSDRRHREALLRCYDGLSNFVDAMGQGIGPEFLALDLRESLAALGEITGETTPELILDRIFTRFCIGK